jgi:hypothetical protein
MVLGLRVECKLLVLALQKEVLELLLAVLQKFLLLLHVFGFEASLLLFALLFDRCLVEQIISGLILSRCAFVLLLQEIHPLVVILVLI